MVAGPVKQIGQECHSKISELPRYLGRIGKGKLRESNDTLWNGKADRAELDGIGQGRRVAGDDHECYRGKLSDCWEGGVWDSWDHIIAIEQDPNAHPKSTPFRPLRSDPKAASRPSRQKKIPSSQTVSDPPNLPLLALTDAGGQRATSISYTNHGSVGGIVGISTVVSPDRQETW